MATSAPNVGPPTACDDCARNAGRDARIADWRRLRFEAVVIRKAPGTLDIADPRDGANWLDGTCPPSSVGDNQRRSPGGQGRGCCLRWGPEV